MSDQKKQHQIPKFFMKNFVRSDNKFSAIITDKNDNNKYLEEIPYKDQCYENFYYGKDLIWENKLKEVEDQASIIIDRIINYGYAELNVEEIANLRELIFLQHVRVPFYVNSIMYKMAHTLMESGNLYLSKKPFGELREIDLKHCLDYIKKNQKRETIDLVLKLAQENSKLCDDLDFLIIEFETNEKLIFGDNPSFIYNQFITTNGGIGMAGVIIFMPISPCVLLLFYDSQLYPKYKGLNRIKINNEIDVIKLNEIQIIGRGNKIFFTNSSYYSKYLYRIYRLRKERSQYIKSFEPNKFGIPDNFVVLYSHGIINKSYDFSFCELHNKAKNLKFKDNVLSRKYEKDYEVRFQTLKRLYPNEEVDEYIMFVEEYWNDNL